MNIRCAFSPHGNQTRSQAFRNDNSPRNHPSRGHESLISHEPRKYARFVQVKSKGMLRMSSSCHSCSDGSIEHRSDLRRKPKCPLFEDTDDLRALPVLPRLKSRPADNWDRDLEFKRVQGGGHYARK